MKTIKVTKARANLYRLLDEASETHDQITGKKQMLILFRKRIGELLKKHFT